MAGRSLMIWGMSTESINFPQGVQEALAVFRLVVALWTHGSRHFRSAKFFAPDLAPPSSHTFSPLLWLVSR